jgi:hypothetical protein
MRVSFMWTSLVTLILVAAVRKIQCVLHGSKLTVIIQYFPPKESELLEWTETVATKQLHHLSHGIVDGSIIS